jgi:hypothetical protein
MMTTSASSSVTAHSRFGYSNGTHAHPTHNNPSSHLINTSHVSIDLTDLSTEMNPSCHCGLPTKQLTTNKEGVNKGRQFYTCTKPRESSCQYFQWADEPVRASTAVTSSSSSASFSSSAPSAANVANAPNCLCGEKASCLKTMKEGENKGREFYACSKRR